MTFPSSCFFLTASFGPRLLYFPPLASCFLFRKTALPKHGVFQVQPSTTTRGVDSSATTVTPQLHKVYSNRNHNRNRNCSHSFSPLSELTSEHKFFISFRPSFPNNRLYWKTKSRLRPRPRKKILYEFRWFRLPSRRNKLPHEFYHGSNVHRHNCKQRNRCYR